MGLFPAIPNTDWMLVAQAADVASAPQKQAMQTLLKLYYPALRGYLGSKWRMSPEQAEEFLQEFLTTKVIGENLIAQAVQDRGRFRSFIRTTLDDFIVTLIRRDALRKRSLAKGGLDAAELIADQGPDAPQAFDLAVAREVIAAAVDGMKRECAASGRADLWALFEARILQPALDGHTPAPYDSLVEKFDFRSPLHAANTLTTAKRMFERNLRLILSSYSNGQGEVDEEIRDLRAILSQA